MTIFTGIEIMEIEVMSNKQSHTGESTMDEKVEAVLEKIRPMLQSDGGDVELVSVEDGIVNLRLIGACGSCPSSTYTLKIGIEQAIREEIPEIKGVEQVA